MKLTKNNKAEVIEREDQTLALPALTPGVDIEETTDSYLLKAAVPGVKKEDVKLQVLDNILELDAAVTASGMTAVTEPRRYSRSFKLGKDINGAAVSATLANGILTVKLEKAPQAQPRRIEIR